MTATSDVSIPTAEEAGESAAELVPLDSLTGEHTGRSTS